ncbi:MAG: hypothetical protein ACLTA1_01685 [Clostridia bacterium]
MRFRSPQTLLGLMGIVHPQVTDKIDKKASIIAVELNVDELSKIAKMLPQYREPSKFPSVTADLSYLIASEVPYSAFQSMVETLALPFLESYELVGIYQDPAWKKQKSVTIRFVFCSQERTQRGEFRPSSIGSLKRARRWERRSKTTDAPWTEGDRAGRAPCLIFLVL